MVFPYPIRISDISKHRISDIGFKFVRIISDIGYWILIFYSYFISLLQLEIETLCQNQNLKTSMKVSLCMLSRLRWPPSPTTTPFLTTPPRSHHQHHEQQKPEASYKAGALLTSISCNRDETVLYF